MSERIFITGITGYLGSAIAARLHRAGYEVHGLTRSPERAAALEALGMHPVVGEIAKSETWLPALKNSDAVIHAAFDGNETATQDRLALEAFRDAAIDGRLRALLYTSGVWVHGDTGGRTIDESEPLAPIELVKWRAVHEDVAIDLAEHDVRVLVLRPGMVYGESRGIFGGLFQSAHEQQAVRWFGTGAQFWSSIHRDDVAEAYLRALERGHGGERYLLVNNSPHTVREMVEAIAKVTGATAQSWDADDLVKKLGPFGRALLTSQKVSSAKAQHDLGWTAQRTSFVHDVADIDREWQATRRTPVS
jgi:nucleoside-diphosphate-sugar epimerase